MDKQLTLDDLFAEIEAADKPETSEEKAERIEAARLVREQRELEKEAYKALQLSKEPVPYVLGKDDITFRTSAWCYDTCGRQDVSFTAVARDKDFVYFWNIGEVEWHQNKDGGITHSNPFLKFSIENDNSNYWHEDYFIWSNEEEWKSICQVILDAGVLPQTEYFDYLFDFLGK